MPQESRVYLRTRPIPAGNLRAFEAVARHLNFRAAADEMALTQSAISRQIQALEEDVGVPLFLRHTRAVELTDAGLQLLHAVQSSLERIDGAVRQVRQTTGRKIVAITTWASFASMWLIPRLEAFQQLHPDIDIRIDASDAMVDLDLSDVDVALRYALASNKPSGAQRLFGEQLTVVSSPWLLKAGSRLTEPADVAHFTLIESDYGHRGDHEGYLSWRRWFAEYGLKSIQPKRWLYFNYANQMYQAALAGQGIALSRTPLVADSLAAGDLVEAMPTRRLDSPMTYWLLVATRSRARPEVQAFCNWLQEQAQATRETIGDGPDADTLGGPD